MISIVFFGTHEFAATVLKAVIASGLFDIKLVVTQPDRPFGRHQEVQKSAVKIIAEKHGLKIDQPESLKSYKLEVISYKLNIVVDYGLIIPSAILNTSESGSINVHPSLLPKYRGASPIQSVLINGEAETAVTIMLMDEQMDHGPILAQEKVRIDAGEMFSSLYAKLSEVAGSLLVKTVPAYLTGGLEPVEQADSLATFTKILSREDGKIDFNESAEKVYNLYRGLTPWPGIFTVFKGKRLKLLRVKKLDLQYDPGRAFVNDERHIIVGCGTGSLEIEELQMEGKKPMEAVVFLNGYIDDINGAQLG